MPRLRIQPRIVSALLDGTAPPDLSVAALIVA
jgi:hypothetical protein